MPSSLKKIATHTFTDGIDSTTAPELKQPTTAEYILNCNTLSSGHGNVGVVTNVKGNKLVSTPLPIGENKCIGTANDEESNMFYFFVWNEFKHHTIQRYNTLSKSVTTILENIQDTANVDIMNLNKDYLILHADVVRNELLFWVDGLNNARKTNINKLLDKSVTGYGTVVMQSFIDAYKQTTPLAPVATYFSDTSKPFNRLYGSLRKFAVRLIYDDGEISNVSDFSAVALPSFEPFTGINTIPTDNNCIKITFTTGDSTVKRIEIFMQSTSAQQNDVSILNWVSIATLDKDKLDIADNSQYTYNFYNDSTYSVADQEKIIRPYSFMPLTPLCQSFVKNAMVYSNGYEGFESVDVDVIPIVTYEDLFLDPGTENEFNNPVLLASKNDDDYVSVGFIIDVNGVGSLIGPGQGAYRFSRFTITIGQDVKKGNKFDIYLFNGFSGDAFNISYEANNTDSSITVANALKQQLISTGRIYRKTPDIAETNIYDNTDVGGDISFSFIFKASRNRLYVNISSYVNPVQFDTLKDTGQSIRNIKMGSSIKYGIIYEDFDGRKSLTYTEDNLAIGIKPINDFKGIDGKAVYKKTTITLTINHKPPKWAKYYQIVRSNDLTYGKYIQMLIQNVTSMNNDDEQDYLELTVGSLYTYQKIHPNSTLTYEFEKGDRLRLLKNADTDVYYDFFETEVISYQDSTSESIKSNITINGSNMVTVAKTNPSDVGKSIMIDKYEREIISVPSSTTYLLNNTIGTESFVFLGYDLIDRRGTIRIRKPASPIVIAPNSMIELYKPSSLSNSLGSSQFYEFQKKFVIISAGTDEAYHTGTLQDQTSVLPAIVTISEGTSYVRNREQPTNNIFPGTQLAIEVVEDPSYSDFYESLFNDNGRVSVEDTGDGVVHFGSRMRFSNNFIEDTRINGLNDFDNTDREDYNDQYGDIKLTKFDTNRIFTFKELKSAFVPVDARITQDNDGIALNVSSSKLLNPIQYMAWEGGIGNNPESYASNGTHKYIVSANSGVIIRIGGNGEEPISKTYSLDNEVRSLLNDATNNKAKIFGGFDRVSGVYVVSIEGYNKYIFFGGFNGWFILGTVPSNSTLFEIVNPPTNGNAILSSGFEITYTPDTDYVGNDSFTYRAFIDGSWSLPKKVCISLSEPPSSLAWRQKVGTEFCVLDQYGFRTGFKGWTTLQEYNIIDNTATGVEKPNVISDPNYVAPIIDNTFCVPQIPDITPDPFSFVPIVDADPSTVYESTIANITGIDVALDISVNIGQYQINGGSWTNVAASMAVNNGDTVRLRQTSAPSNSTTTTQVLSLGSVTASFDVTTSSDTPICPNRVVVLQLCKPSSVINDNFSIYLNDVLVGSVNFNTIAATGSAIIGSNDTPDITDPDFVCTIPSMVHYYFDPTLIIGGNNVVKMVNTQNNGSGNNGSLGVREYVQFGDDLVTPCVISDFTYSGVSGSNFEFTFSYIDCCSEDGSS